MKQKKKKKILTNIILTQFLNIFHVIEKKAR